jgi:hypothetical protein
MSGATFCQQENVVGRMALVSHDRISGESALYCSRQDSSAINRGQTIEES